MKEIATVNDCVQPERTFHQEQQREESKREEKEMGLEEKKCKRWKLVENKQITEAQRK